MHDNHFDRVAAQKLDKNIPLLTTLEATVELKQKGFNSIYSLNTWETITVSKGEVTLRITAMPGRHGLMLLASLLPPVIGSMLEFQTPSGKTSFRLYIYGGYSNYPTTQRNPSALFGY
jgi:hypothetical protein